MISTFEFIKKHIVVFFCLFLSILVLWTMLLPGYILTLDMVFTPEMKINIYGDGFLNFLPLQYLIGILTLMVPGWVAQKIMLFALFFSLPLLSYKFLPLPQNRIVRMFGALLYTVNPFVYTRLIAGHWTHLLAYALMPVFIYSLFKLTEVIRKKHTLYFFLSLYLISLFSLHFFLMGILLAADWIVLEFIKMKNETRLLFLKQMGVGFVLFCIASSFWILPAVFRDTPLESRFSVEHFEAFKASGNGEVPVLLNLASMNGFWGEGEPWASYFAWPQLYPYFWVAFAFLIILILIGAFILLREKKIGSKINQIKTERHKWIFIGSTTIAAFIFSAGLADTPFYNFNLWLYKNVPYWSGFRDSQKFIGIVVLGYTIFASHGLNFIINRFKNIKIKFFDLKHSVYIVLLIPLILGMGMLGGYSKQLRSVWYPDAWYEAKVLIENEEVKKVLVLPWQGYFSLKFNNNLITANPAEAFFGNKAIISRNVRLGEIYDQESASDTSYNILDQVVRRGFVPDGSEPYKFLLKNNITHVLFLEDILEADTNKYVFLNNSHFEKILIEKNLILYKINK